MIARERCCQCSTCIRKGLIRSTVPLLLPKCASLHFTSLTLKASKYTHSYSTYLSENRLTKQLAMSPRMLEADWLTWGEGREVQKAHGLLCGVCLKAVFRQASGQHQHAITTLWKNCLQKTPASTAKNPSNAKFIVALKVNASAITTAAPTTGNTNRSVKTF